MIQEYDNTNAVEFDLVHSNLEFVQDSIDKLKLSRTEVNKIPSPLLNISIAIDYPEWMKD